MRRAALILRRPKRFLTVSLWSKKSDTLWNRVFVCFINRIKSESLCRKNRPDRLGIESWLKRFLEATQATQATQSDTVLKYQCFLCVAFSLKATQATQ